MGAWRAWRMRWKRRRFLARALIKSRQLTKVKTRLENIAPDAILAFMCIRNEMVRLPHFLDYHRKLGVDHFLIVDNASDDDSQDFLQAQPDVSLWTTTASYRSARFGVDWLNHLLARYGSGHWCLTLDADELLFYQNCETCDLRELIHQLGTAEQDTFNTLMLDLYPKGPLGTQRYQPGEDPLKILEWFDANNYRTKVQPLMGNRWVQGGPRARVFFADRHWKAPTLNKIPLVKWHWRYVYMNSTHSLLPPRLNAVSDSPKGVLLHTKFLPTIIDRSREEKERGEHFGTADQYAHYYDDIIAGPDLWYEGSQRFEGWEKLRDLKLL